MVFVGIGLLSTCGGVENVGVASTGTVGCGMACFCPLLQ